MAVVFVVYATITITTTKMTEMTEMKKKKTMEWNQSGLSAESMCMFTCSSNRKAVYMFNPFE